MQAQLFRFFGITAHFRDPRYNTGSLDTLPLRTLRCPPPCTVHGLICAAAGGWVEPESLTLGWRMEYASAGLDFQTCQLPKRNKDTKVQTTTEASPRQREHLTFPVFHLLAVEGIKAEWFRKPANPLSLGRSEDLIVRVKTEKVLLSEQTSGVIQNQCLPFGVGYGTLYAAPLYFVENRKPVGMAPLTDSFSRQEIQSDSLMYSHVEQEAYYIWEYKNATG